MKILLTTLNSKYVHSNLALKYLYQAGAPFCEGEGCFLDIKEFTINNSQDLIFSELVRVPCDLICFSCYIWNREKILELAEDLKKALPGVQILLGGPEVSFETEAFLREHPWIDYVLSGEGETGFAQLCEVLSDVSGKCRLSLEDVKGLSYWKAGAVVVNPAAEPLPFERVPFPYDLFPCETDKVIYYESSRGCPYRCSYCISSLEKTVRPLPLERVKQDLLHFIRSRVKQVKFVDRTFNWDKKRSMELLRYLMEYDNEETNFHFEICGDLLDEEMIGLLSKARKGLFQFEIGIQSTNEDTLKAINRTTDTKRALRNVKALVDLGNSHIHTDLIAGLPYEDFSRFRDSFNEVYAVGADDLQLGFLKMLRGTDMRRDAEKYGYRYKSRAPYEVISNQFLSSRELNLLKQVECVLSLYHNRDGFQNSLEYAIMRYAETPFDFYLAFAEFYHRNGYHLRSHRKEDLYRIFYQYIHTVKPDSEMDRILEADLEASMNFDAVKKFKRKGWQLSQVNRNDRKKEENTGPEHGNYKDSNSRCI